MRKNVDLYEMLNVCNDLKSLLNEDGHR